MDWTLGEYERIEPQARIDEAGVAMTFVTPNQATLWRVQTLREKEPWTLEWLGTFEEEDVFFDIGANVGMYSIWAAATRNVQVYAFEPESQNYALLNRNILRNGLADRVTAYCLGLSDQPGLSILHLSDTTAGGSCHAVGEALDFAHRPLAAAFRQGCVAETLDRLVSAGALPIPDHIKIDIDGFEPRVLAGAKTTLQQPDVRSLLIELNGHLADHRQMVEDLRALGFRHDPAQVARAERREGTFQGVAEYIFRR